MAAAVAGTLSLGACGHGGWRHGQGDGPVAMTPEEAGRRIDKVVEWVLSDVDASAEQKQRVGEIARGAARELIPLREQHRQARGRALDLFAQPVLDRAAIERLRAEELALADQASRVLVAALSDAMEVLTPAQRVQLAERVRRRHG